jgi:DUF1365 family protein
VTTLASGLYPGVVTHARLRPRAHRLRHRIFMLLLDLDELEQLDGALKFFAHRRFGLASFHEADHLDGTNQPLKPRLEAELAAAGIAHGGAIRVLCMPRVLGGVFNPLSVYFCHGSDGRLSAILYEVSNTFGERHSYLIPAQGADLVFQACDKRFYVSPFMDMELAYAFRVAPPGERVSVAVDVHDAQGQVLATAFAGRRLELTDAALIRAWLTHPLMTLGVMAAIHWRALFIWLKGEPIRKRPGPPDAPLTVVSSAGLQAH